MLPASRTDIWTNCDTTFLPSVVYRVAQKTGTLFVRLNSIRLNFVKYWPISNLFHCLNQQNICNNTVTKDPITPQVCRYTTLWNESVLKSEKCMGRIASEEVILQLLYSKCVPILLYSLEVCPLNISDIRSLDFAIDRFFMKLLKTNNINIVRLC